MAYSTSNPPVMLVQSVDGGNARRIWLYTGTDADSAVYAAGYFTNGLELGMQKGDILMYLKTDTPELYIHVCTVATSDAALAFGSSPATSS